VPFDKVFRMQRRKEVVDQASQERAPVPPRGPGGWQRSDNGLSLDQRADVLS